MRENLDERKLDCLSASGGPQRRDSLALVARNRGLVDALALQPLESLAQHAVPPCWGLRFSGGGDACRRPRTTNTASGEGATRPQVWVQRSCENFCRSFTSNLRYSPSQRQDTAIGSNIANTRHFQCYTHSPLIRTHFAAGSAKFPFPSQPLSPSRPLS